MPEEDVYASYEARVEGGSEVAMEHDMDNYMEANI